MDTPRGTILVVDDDFLNRALLATNLEEQGFSVEKAEAGRQALDLLRASKLARLVRPKDHEEEKALQRAQLLTAKPVLYVCNVDEADAANGNEQSARVFERARAEEALRRELDVNRAVSELSRALISEASSIQDVADSTLHYARALTGSEHGFVSFIDPRTGDAVAYPLTSMMEKECQRTGEDRRIAFPVGPDGRYPKLWARHLRERGWILKK